MLRVYILSKNDLFGQGVASLLRRETEIEIVGQGLVVDQAIEDIQRLKPDAVVVESSDAVQNSALNVTRILKTEVPVKVIGLDLTENKFHLYHQEQREARSVEDLVNAIRTELPASHFNDEE